MDPRSISDLPGNALVIRAGLAKPADIATAVATGHVNMGRPSLSVMAGADATIDVLTAAPHIADRKYVRRTTADALYDLGFPITKTGGPWHHTVWLPDDDPATLQRFIDALQPPEPNPSYVPRPNP